MAKKGPYAQRKENVSLKRQRPVPEMCDGCARNLKAICEVINEPAYFWENYGNCFAWIDATRAQEINEELFFIAGGRWHRKKLTV